MPLIIILLLSSANKISSKFIVWNCFVATSPRNDTDFRHCEQSEAISTWFKVQGSTFKVAAIRHAELVSAETSSA